MTGILDRYVAEISGQRKGQFLGSWLGLDDESPSPILGDRLTFDLRSDRQVNNTPEQELTAKRRLWFGGAGPKLQQVLCGVRMDERQL